MAYTHNPSTWGLRKNGCHEFESNLGPRAYKGLKTTLKGQKYGYLILLWLLQQSTIDYVASKNINLCSYWSRNWGFKSRSQHGQVLMTSLLLVESANLFWGHQSQHWTLTLMISWHTRMPSWYTLMTSWQIPMASRHTLMMSWHLINHSKSPSLLSITLKHGPFSNTGNWERERERKKNTNRKSWVHTRGNGTLKGEFEMSLCFSQSAQSYSDKAQTPTSCTNIGWGNLKTSNEQSLLMVSNPNLNTHRRWELCLWPGTSVVSVHGYWSLL